MPIHLDDDDEHTGLLAGDEEQAATAPSHGARAGQPNGRPHKAADEGRFQMDSGRTLDEHKGVSGKHSENLTHRDYGLLWKTAARAGTRAKHRKDISERLRELDTSEWEVCSKSEQELKEIKNVKVREYYRDQNARISAWLEVDAVVRALAEEVLQSFEPMDLDQDGIAEAGGNLQVNSERIVDMLPEQERQKRQKEARQARIAINVNVAANVLLVAAKSIAAVFSSSLSLIASLADSVLDLLMTLIIYTTSKLVSWKSSKLQRLYPVGRRRLQPLGTLVFSVIMVVSFLQILHESVNTLLGPDHKVPKLPAVAIGSMAATIGLKGAIWFGCRWQNSSQVQALAQDCKTDVIFNIASLFFPAVGVWAGVWWLECVKGAPLADVAIMQLTELFSPVGAGLLSIYIIFDWARTCLEHVNHLSGAHVDDAMLRKLMYLAWRFSPVVNAFKNMQAYHAGDGIWVELDVLLDPNVDLRHAHDLAELIQYCYEGLAEVDRAFVTVDYAEQGPSGHALIE